MDGLIDIVVGNNGSADRIMMNKGNNKYEYVELGEKNIDTQAIQLGDMDGDGLVDIVVGVFGGRNYLYQNNGTSAYRRFKLPGGDTETTKLELGDLNGDGQVDIVLLNEGADNEILLNRGGGEFAQLVLPFLKNGKFYDAQNDSTNVKDGAEYVALGDLNNDGEVDVVLGIDPSESSITSASSAIQIEILMNGGGKGRYETKTLPNEKYFGSSAVILEDLNGDGILDMVIGNTIESNEVFMSNNKGTYDVTDLLDSTHYTTSLAVGDFNNDGRFDLVVGNYDNIQLYTDNGNNNYVPKTISVFDEGARDTEISSIAIGHLDGDEFLDIVIGTVGSENLILYNNPLQSFDIRPLPGGMEGQTKAIALGDFDGNDQLDITIGNEISENMVLLNNGTRTFNISYVFDDSSTSCIALGDLNNDTKLDIVVGNDLTDNNTLWLNNGDGTFTGSPLPRLDNENNIEASSIALGDLNGDGIVDIVIGNNKGKNLLLQKRKDGENFHVKSLEAESSNQEFKSLIVLGDVNGDGVIDIVIANKDSTSQVMFQSSCPHGGAQRHAYSWCFKCPNYMGRPTFIDHEQSSCVECLRDTMQESGVGEACDAYPCTRADRRLGERKLGVNECMACSSGTFYDNSFTRTPNNMTSWKLERCVPCPQGQSSLEVVRGKCDLCNAGEHQPEEGQNSCIVCSQGKFQPVRGQAECIPCNAGGYCNEAFSCNGGFKSCEPGTYNEIEGQSREEACISCGIGTFSAVTGANSSTTCDKCPPGSFGNGTGQTKCQRCLPGSNQPESGQSSCFDCPEGTFSDKEGSFKCIPCPYRLSSFPASNTCFVCASGFYLNDTLANQTDIFDYPRRYCIGCPQGVECALNTTLQTLKLPVKHWRDSLDTSILYLCDNKVCLGSQESENRRLNLGNPNAPYCEDGHEGPLCEVCTRNKQYFNPREGRCYDCPSLWWYIITVLVLVIVVRVVYFCCSRVTIFQQRVDQFRVTFSNIGGQAKIKIIISFYQVVNALGTVYGVKVDESFKPWFRFLSFFDFSLETVISGQCVGSMSLRMAINAAWPFIIILLGFLVIVYTLSMRMRGTGGRNSTDLKTKLWGYTLKFTIIFMYLVLPGVSRTIFDALKCTEFKTNDKKNSFHTYLLSDLTLYCDTNKSSEYSGILRLFWGLFVLWPLLVPLAMLAMVWKIRHAVRSKSTTPLAEACSFLWRDYSESFFYWEIIDLYRKIILTGFLLVIDQDKGSTKILRLLLAILISVLYFGFLLRARPYRRSNDLDLAFISNILLLSCFVLGISLHICKDENNCQNYIGSWFTSRRATIITVILTAVMLLISAVFLVILAVNAITAPSVRLTSTGSKPNLEMSGDCEFHAFLSHIWSTGKDKTHTIVRKIQLLLPGVRIWLDVDQLSKMDQLENSVKTSAVFLIFYSKGYFRSKNCRREVYAAVEFNKPIYTIYEGDEFDLEEVKAECRRFCTDGAIVADRVFATTPIQWLGGGGAHFAIEAVKLVSFSILTNLPFYMKLPGQLQPGLKVAGELGPVELSVPVDIFVCASNVGARRVIEEAKTTLSTQGDLINILDSAILHNTTSFLETDDISVDNKKFLVLYLDEDIFLDEDDEVYATVRAALKMNIEVINVHELDSAMGACSFETFFTQTPSELIEPPYTLYRDIAVPLYSLPEYRKVSLRQLLMKLGAHEVGKEHTSTSTVHSAALLLRNSFRISSVRNLKGHNRPKKSIGSKLSVNVTAED